MVQPGSDKLCRCDQCTLQGRRPQGSMQSHSASQSHKIDQHIRSFRGPTIANVESTTLRQTLRGFDTVEDPLWRGSSAEAPIGRTPDQSRLPTNREQFVFPTHLVFNHPPATLTDMYPGSTEPDWTKGPSGLRPDKLVNSPILIYMKHLVGRRHNPSEISRHAKINREIHRLESFRCHEWVKQQHSCPDPGSLLQHTGIFYDSGQSPR